jgi:hypothetical protein
LEVVVKIGEEEAIFEGEFEARNRDVKSLSLGGLVVAEDEGERESVR